MYKEIISIAVLAFFSIEMCGQCNPVNLFQNNPQAAPFSSQSGTSNAPGLAFDIGSDSLNTKWFATYRPEGHELGVDFGVPFDFCSIRLVWGANEYPPGIVIRGTNDFNTWTELANISNNTQAIRTIDLPYKGNFRIIDIYVYGTISGGTGYGLYNMKLYDRATNQPPTVSVNADANNLFGSDITLTATASDPDAGGSISKVEFYQGSTKLGEDLSSPYSYTWTGAAINSYTVTAKAYDNLGAVTTSSAIAVNVTAAPSYLNNWTLNGNNINNANSGIVFIGGVPASARPDAANMKLSVNGDIYARKLTVTIQNWADYVFDKKYKLPSLGFVSDYVKKYKHLPGVPSAADTENNGVSVGDNQAILLKKIEELTLYLIKQETQLQQQHIEIEKLKKSFRK